MAPTLIGVAGATVVARRLGAQSIYSARLGAKREVPAAAHISEDVNADLDVARMMTP